MVTIDLDSRIIRVVESKVRKDHDEWFDVPDPIGNLPTVSYVWEACRQEQSVGLLELYTGSSRLTKHCI